MTNEPNHKVLLLRHASAPPKFSDTRLDRFRGLDQTGLRQAELLATSLARGRPPAVLTSVARRCIETVEPLARMLGLELEARPELATDTTLEALRQLLASCRPGTVLCTHREVIELFTGEGGAPRKAGALVIQVGSETHRPFGMLPPPTDPYQAEDSRQPEPSTTAG